MTTPLLSDQGSVGLVQELRYPNHNLQFGEGTVAAIADRGKGEAAAAVESACPVVRGGSAAAALSDGAQLPSTAATVAAIADRGAGSGLRAANLQPRRARRTRSFAALAAPSAARTCSPDESGRTPRSAGPATLHLYIFDSMGNVRHKVLAGDGSLRVAATYEYDPFGRLLYADPPPVYETAPQFLFSTKLYESHWQHYYCGYRYYSPDIGRWLSRDPIGEADGPNVYGFVRNAPLIMIDGVGLFAVVQPVEASRCTVMLRIGHLTPYNKDFAKDLHDRAQLLDSMSRYGLINCGSAKIQELIPEHNRIKDLPVTNSRIGTRRGQANDYNAGYGEGIAGYKAMLEKAKEAAEKAAEDLAEDCQCQCKQITMRVICQTKDEQGCKPTPKLFAVQQQVFNKRCNAHHYRIFPCKKNAAQ